VSYAGLAIGAGFSVATPFHVGKYADIQSAALVATHQKFRQKPLIVAFQHQDSEQVIVAYQNLTGKPSL
jgi:hypothetical protein